MTRKIKRCTIPYDHFKKDLEIWYSSTLTIREMDEYVCDMYPDENDQSDILVSGTLGALTIVNDGMPVIVLFNKGVTMNIIVHESIHISQAFFCNVGSQHNEQTDELYAYATEKIFTDIVNTLVNKFKIPKSSLLKE